MKAQINKSKAQQSDSDNKYLKRSEVEARREAAYLAEQEALEKSRAEKLAKKRKFEEEEAQRSREKEEKRRRLAEESRRRREEEEEREERERGEKGLAYQIYLRRQKGTRRRCQTVSRILRTGN